nr:reverse transcriptase domain-containing protein [Tanacetum cinerariifolium]
MITSKLPGSMGIKSILNRGFRKLSIQSQMIVPTSRFFLSANSTEYLVSTVDGTMSLKELNSTKVRLLSSRFYVLTIITSLALTSGPSEVLSVRESHNLCDSNSQKGLLLIFYCCYGSVRIPFVGKRGDVWDDLKEIGMSIYRTAAVDVVHNDEELWLNLDLLEEQCERTVIREAKAKSKMTKYYNARVHGVTFRLGDFVYRSNDASHAVDGGKLGPK